MKNYQNISNKINFYILKIVIKFSGKWRWVYIIILHEVSKEKTHKIFELVDINLKSVDRSASSRINLFLGIY